MNDPEISICCGRGKCPVVSVDKEHDFIEITDDFGGVVTIPVAQAPKVAEAFKTILAAVGATE